MPTFTWPTDPVQIINDFGNRHPDSEATALLLFAIWTVDSLYYLQDLDDEDNLSKPTIRGHRPDVVDVAHSRWATGACITALDLCSAALGRALCGYTDERELALANFYREQKRFRALRALLSPAICQWLDDVNTDPQYNEIKAVRNALTHARVIRHFTLPRRRLQIQAKNVHLDVSVIVRQAKDVATRHVLRLLTILPDI